MAEHSAQRDPSERRTVAGLIAERASAEQAIDALKGAGFTGDHIGVALRDRTAQGVLMEEAQAVEGATACTLGGGLLGGLTGFLIGIGALAIPGFGLVVAGSATLRPASGRGVCSSPWRPGRACWKPWPSWTGTGRIPGRPRGLAR